MKRDLLVEIGYEDAVVFENPSYDDAIVGVTTNGEVVYDYSLMVECLVSDGMSVTDAMEFIDYNTLRALDYCTTSKPIVIHRLEEFE